MSAHTHTDHPGSRQSPQSRWMGDLPDDLPISEINIPGSHNAAAINKRRRTRWACQAYSITEQLTRGIRLLDIRLKPKKPGRPQANQSGSQANHSGSQVNHSGSQVNQSGPQAIQSGSQASRETTAPSWDFITCHGHLGLRGANEFQPFDEILEECMAFLDANPTETIIMTIQIDSWRGTRPQDRPHILKTLQTRIAALPLLTGPGIPTLGDSRGRIYLLNRINDDPALGVPINIPDNTPGVIIAPAAARNYEVYVQDQYKRLNRRHPEAHKFQLTIAALEHKRPGAVLLNFASATKPFGRFVYIMQNLSQYFSEKAAPQPAAKNSAPKKPLGWLLLDYPFTTYTTSHNKTPDLPTLIIVSNYTKPADYQY